ncbi:uncharacterized protein VP01_1287g2 [Puccinia sorghi]|uniref:Bromodomain-containing protein n=1 Tax=Puccinia sorghi TaxID=27349 RepID=A0A0L6VNI5_9BASI|nr:uncharacterized protein VP01_1287g2 [Puccinia sorghi]
MATVIDHHEQSPDSDAPINSPEQSCLPDAVIVANTWSSPPPAFPVTPHDVSESDRPLEKSLQTFQSQVPLSSSIPASSPDYKPDSGHPTELSHPQHNRALIAQTDQQPTSTIHPSPPPSAASASPSPTPPSPPPSVEHRTSNDKTLGTALAEPSHTPSCALTAATSAPLLSDTSIPAVQPHTLKEVAQHNQAPHAVVPETLRSVSSGTYDVAPLAEPEKGNIPLQPAADSHPSADLNINLPIQNPSLPEPPENSNPRRPISTDSNVNTEQTHSSSAAIPPASTTPTHSTAEQVVPHDYSAASTPPPQDIRPTNSTNSLSPLSDVPSVPSPPCAIESPCTEASQLPPPLPTSPPSFKRHPSPSMHENDIGSHRREGSPTRFNESQSQLNGRSAPKRPRLDNDFPSNPLNNSSFAHPVSESLQMSNLPPPAPSLHPVTATDLPQSMFQATGIIPGTLGTRLTKDQHRFAVSVTKQLKKHRSAGPFLAPVDPVALNIPDYFDVVKHPMDLNTIETRLGKVGKPCDYRSVEEFVADIQLVFSNCYLYNGPPTSSFYSRAALELSIQFETQMKKMPPDEPLSHASTSRSPSLAKLPSKPKQSTETRAPPAVPKRKSGSPMTHHNAAQSAHQNGGQKRRSSSPQHPRKKSTKVTSSSVSTLIAADSGNPLSERRTSMNDSSSQRPRTSTWDQASYGVPDGSTSQREFFFSVVPHIVEQPTISNAKAELKFCKDLLREVNKKTYSKFVWPFYEPVDIVKLGIPDYPKFVKKPMDLETMKQKLKNNEYPNGAAFAADFRLMLNNCFTFNPSGTYHECGKQLERLFEARWAERPPEEIPAPAPPAVAPISTAPASLDPSTIQEIQLQIAHLQERLDSVDATNIGHVGAHAVSGTAPAKKQSISRAVGPARSSPNLSNSAALVTPSAPFTASKTKAAGAAKVKQAHGGARRKSAGSSMAPVGKPQTQSLEQQSLPSQSAQLELAPESYRPIPPPAATAPPAPTSAGKKSSSASDYYEVIDYEQKKDLANQIQNAVEPMQSDAINLIRTSRPDLVAADGEEIELDIDALDDRTLYRLYQLVCVPLLPPTKPKKPKAATANGKPKAPRKAAPGGSRKSMPSQMTPHAVTNPQATDASPAEVNSISPYTSAQRANGHENGAKPKVKKPRASVPGGPAKRKGIDETQEAARIKELEEKLHQFTGATAPYQPPLNHSNGVSPANPVLGLTSSAPPAGPVEYASSSSESESESDDDSD